MPIKVPPWHERVSSPPPAEKESWTDLGHPPTDVVPTDSDNISPLEGPSVRMIKGTVSQQSSISEPQALEEFGLGHLDIPRHRGVIVRRQCHVFRVSEYETFISFADDPSLASSVKKVEEEMSEG